MQIECKYLHQSSMSYLIKYKNKRIWIEKQKIKSHTKTSMVVDDEHLEKQLKSERYSSK